MQQGALARSFNRQPAEHKWPRGESEILSHVVPFEPDELNRFRLPELLLRDHEFGVVAFKKLTCFFKSGYLL